ncbi:fumarate hydratase C-terminal domain-containing protein [Pseudomonas tolaasii]|uniref:fumarate hydratase C-terminal domain-containing protein n=1 Tax=Pseudomonas tolaasii TaxID=29442 RepID=UPI001C6006F1|nr:fumarate hydratase C-terminal domain-containing protein [Pseudomonas tolaasii]MBW4793251.1 fumarate hydratase C-terminal domain-containing protein [Pseudomonas tolaasii]
MTTHRISTPLTDDIILKLKAGDEVLLSGVIYMARDAAHKRFIDTLARGETLPFDIRGQVLFYGGPGPTKPGHVIGVVAPTSAYRMDPYAVELFRLGIKGAIGKGNRGPALRECCRDTTTVCFSAIGGISATLFSCIKSAQVICYEDLKTEAVQRLVVEDMPLLVTNDAYGQDMYQTQVKKYRDLLNA